VAKANKNQKNISDRFKELGLESKRLSSDKLIGKDGRLNMIRRRYGFHSFSLYHWLIGLIWVQFFIFVTLSFVCQSLIY
jgi:hypothetical protein